MPKLVVIGVRFSYCNLTTPRVPQGGGEPKYSCTILLPKTQTEMLQQIRKAVEDAVADGVKTKWNGIRPPIVNIPIHDGDGVRPSDGMPFGDECKGHWVFSASSKDAPQIVDKHVMPILNPSDTYSGMYGNVSVNFYPYLHSGKKGIGCGLNNVMKTADGDALAGRASASSDFAGFDEQGDFAFGGIDPITGVKI